MKDHFPHLFTPQKIGPLTLKNRIVMAPIDTNLADEKGNVTDALLAFYERRASGGTGMIIVENSQVDFPRGKNTQRQLSIHENKKIEGLKRLADTIRRGGAVPAIQIHHAGRETTLEVTDGLIPVAPSPIPCGHLKTPVRALSREEIETLVGSFVTAAARGKRAGFDLVEIHGAHGYLVGQFLSPHTNKREDEYGGDFHGRMRFTEQIIHGIKETMGSDFPISFRFSADEFVPGGIDVKEGTRIARALEQAGVDVLHVSAGIYESLPTLLEPMSYGQGWRCYLASEIKKAVKIPVIAVGVIREPSFAERIIAEGKCDLVAIGRGLLADPEWPTKAKKGRVAEIRRCIGCNEGCLNKRLTKSIQCSVNPETGRELNFQIGPSRRPGRRITIVGGGPAGLEAARVAALRGFHVTLFEKSNHLGGQMCLASVPPGKEKISWTVQYYEDQMNRLGVQLRLALESQVKDILGTAPDIVILATGSTPVQPPASSDSPPPFTPDEILTSSWHAPTGRAAVVGGGGIGCETALYLRERGLDVSIFEQMEVIARDAEPITAWDLKDRITRAGISVHLQTRVIEVQKDVLFIERQGEKLTGEAFDMVVWATGRSPNLALAEELKQTPFAGKLHVIGDASLIGKIHDAVYQAYTLVKDL